MSSIPTEIDWMKNVPIFSELNSQQIVELAKVFSEKSYVTDEEIIKEGETGHVIYIVKSGGVNIYRKDNQGNDIYLTMLGEYQYFGESVLFGSFPRTSTVRAALDTICIETNKDHFLEFLNHNPESAVKVLMSILKEIFHRMFEIGQELAYERQGGLSQADIDKMLK